VLAGVLAWIASPWMGKAVRATRLAREPAPTALPVPVEGVASQQIADTWGAARGQNRRHEGVDIFAARGTPVRATTHGFIVRRGTNRLGGRIVVVAGPDWQYHYYAHLDNWAGVGVGDWVERGTVLGFVGDSGNARGTPPHLHYGIYTDDGPINPHPLLAPP
jgi:murein DD-endopeptidase MepM/ murein hydrolase activator NlpD